MGEGERYMILLVLRARFGPELPNDLVKWLNQLEEPDELEPLGELAAQQGGSRQPGSASEGLPTSTPSPA
jgi:hypothetical protein